MLIRKMFTVVATNMKIIMSRVLRNFSCKLLTFVTTGKKEYLKYMCEKQLHPPNLSPTDYDNQDEDDFLTWDLESYRESNYMEIVLGLSEEYFGYSDFNSQQDYKQNLFFRCDENENHQISSAQKVESQAMNDCENRNPKLSR
ncbi:uncharacterized protein LOC111626704 isoform X2 [Centruroides sculpturatus]|uniref:uncharacterized protein LOC111626704 isoform X2 n=1 Tax=Centruroides sculpturatus TaxID=218467 RepID=UPI000C6DD79F|nr:uncharacterized protein LOC111626704 isoform X2 [Centruroides sculpturatus]